MPIRMTDDKNQGRPSQRPGGNMRGGSGGGGLGSLLPMILGFLIKKPKLLLVVVVVGALFYFLGGSEGCAGGGGGNIASQVLQLATGANFSPELYDKTEVFEARYIPHEEIAALAKTDCRYVLVTGVKDFNLKNTSAVYENGFLKEGFKSVELMNIPGQGHQPPKAEWLKKAIEFLDGKK